MQKLLHRDRAGGCSHAAPEEAGRAAAQRDALGSWGSLRWEGAHVIQAKEQSVTGHCAPAGRQDQDDAGEGSSRAGTGQARASRHAAPMQAGTHAYARYDAR